MNVVITDIKVDPFVIAMKSFWGILSWGNFLIVYHVHTAKVNKNNAITGRDVSMLKII
jgi:hypothetical protein